MVGLDPGTTCVTAVVARPREDSFEVVGVGTAPSAGIRGGVVVNVEPAAGAVSRAVHEAEVMAGCEIHSVFVGVGGRHVRGWNSHGVVAVRGREVERSDVERVLETASAVALPPEERILHVLPQHFVLDGRERVFDPVGMNGVRLEAYVHLVVASWPSVENLRRCCERAGLHVAGVLGQPVASAEAVLADEERELGVLVLDIGGGTTGVAVYREGSLRHTAVLPWGGRHVTNDIAYGLKVSSREAEILKRRHATCRAREVDPEESVEVSSVSGEPRFFARRKLAQIVEARMEEIFSLVRRHLRWAGVEPQDFPCGVVLTGGTARLPGCEELGRDVLGAAVRVGRPLRAFGRPEVETGPEFSTAVGLLRLASPGFGAGGAEDEGVFGKVRRRVAGWLREFF